uniref:Uncharacterized protein n=1 Tax=Anguilla anguilla TaxID=7936 RepID=A0A0E9Q797_ANGAN
MIEQSYYLLWILIASVGSLYFMLKGLVELIGNYRVSVETALLPCSFFVIFRLLSLCQ